MKLILAIIKPTRLEAVQQALAEIEVFRLTIVDCQGFGRQKGQREMNRAEQPIALTRKVQIQVAVNDSFVEPTVQAIASAAKSTQEGEIGDGKIFVLPIEDCLRIRTGERGEDAI